MISKVFITPLIRSIVGVRPTILNQNFTFCTAPNNQYEYNPLRAKIIDLSSLSQFQEFYKQKNNQFDNSCYSLSSKVLGKILSDQKKIINYQQRHFLIQFLDKLQNIDISSLKFGQFSQILSLLKTLKLDSINKNVWAMKYITPFVAKSEQKINQIEEERNPHRLALFYSQFCGLGTVRQCLRMVRKLNEILKDNESNEEEKSLSVPTIINIFKGMKYRQEFTFEQRKLLRNIIQVFHQHHLNSVSFFELVQVSCGINEIYNKNKNYQMPFNLVDQIHNKVLQNIEEMDEKSIMFLLNSNKTGSRTYDKIYKILFDKIFDQIQPNGQSSFNNAFTFKLFQGISSKLKLSAASEQNKQKFYNFISQVLSKGTKGINSHLQTMVVNNFFNKEQINKIGQILGNNSTQSFFKISLIYELSKRRVDVSKLIDIDAQKISYLKDTNFILFSKILKNLSENSNDQKQYEQLLNNCRQRFLELYKNQNIHFSKFIDRIQLKYLPVILQVFRKQIENDFTNPFQTEQNKKYRENYFKLMLLGNSQTQFKKNYKKLFKNNIKTEDMNTLFRVMLHERSQLEGFYTNVLETISHNVDTIISDKRQINYLVNFLTREVSSIFSDRQDSAPKIKFWSILNEFSEKMDTKMFINNFQSLISKMIKSKEYQFNYSEQYRSFIRRIFNSINYFDRFLKIDLIQEALRLHTISKQNVTLINQDTKKLLSDKTQMLLQMLENRQFFLKNTQIKKQNLHLFLFNNNQQNRIFLKENVQKIQAIIQQMKAHQIWKVIEHFRAGNSVISQRILSALFKRLNKQTTLWFKFNFNVVRQLLKRNNMLKNEDVNENIQEYMKKNLEYYSLKYNIQKMNYLQHLTLIQMGADLKVFDHNYLHAVLTKYKYENPSSIRGLFLICSLLNYKFDQKEINFLIKRKFFIHLHKINNTIKLFLLTQDQLPNPQQQLQIIITKYQQKEQEENYKMPQIYYQYLKKKYPQQTKNFKPKGFTKKPISQSLESLNLKQVSQLRQVLEEVLQQKLTEHVVNGNYYYSIKKINLVFPQIVKYKGLNNLFKKILTTVTGQENFLILNKSKPRVHSFINYIALMNSDIITKELKQKLHEKASQKLKQIQSQKNQQNSEEDINQDQQETSTIDQQENQQQIK